MPNQNTISFLLCWTTVIASVLILIVNGQQQTTRGCGSCMTRNQKKEYDIQMFKDKILHKLRLSSPPTGPHLRRVDLEKIPSMKAMIQDCERAQEDLIAPRDGRAARRCSGPHCGHVSTPGHDHEMLMDEPQGHVRDDGGDDDDEARTLVNVFQVPDQERSSGSTVRFSLDSYASNAADLESAVLGLYLEETRSSETSSRSAIVYVYRNVRANGWYGPITTEFIRKKRVTIRPRGSSGFWVYFNLTQFALSWIQQPFTNLGLHLEAYDLKGQQLHVISLVNTGQAEHRPYLQLQFRDPESFGQAAGSRLARSRRSHSQSDNCNEVVQQSHCCRYSLVIDFKDFGWDNWIISPKKASVYYCSGECPYLYHTATMAGHMGRQVVGQGPLPGEPCCAPTKFSDLKLLYISDNGTYAHSELPNIIVDKCGCW